MPGVRKVCANAALNWCSYDAASTSPGGGPRLGSRSDFRLLAWRRRFLLCNFVRYAIVVNPDGSSLSFANTQKTQKTHSLWDGKAAGANRSFKAPAALPPDVSEGLIFRAKFPIFRSMPQFSLTVE